MKINQLFLISKVIKKLYLGFPLVGECLWIRVKSCGQTVLQPTLSSKADQLWAVQTGLFLPNLPALIGKSPETASFLLKCYYFSTCKVTNHIKTLHCLVCYLEVPKIPFMFGLNVPLETLTFSQRVSREASQNTWKQKTLSKDINNIRPV